MDNRRNVAEGPAVKVAFMGLLFALAMALAFWENMWPALPFLPVGVKLGLSNIVTMYALFFLGVRQGAVIAVLKALFVLFTRGPVGGALSLAGGLSSVLVMFLFSLVKYPGTGRREARPALGYGISSMGGAVAHNIGQILLAAAWVGHVSVLYHLPVAIIAGMGLGFVTGMTMRVLGPYLDKLKMRLPSITQGDRN